MLQQLEQDPDFHDFRDLLDPQSPNPKQLDKQLEKQLKHQLWSAAQRNDCDRVKSVLGVADIDLTRALFVAAANDHHECVTAFVAAILSENSTWRRRHVHYYLLHDALARAAFAGALRAMRVLVEAGAYQYGQRQLFGAVFHPYVWAAHSKQTRALQLLLDAKTDVNRIVSLTKPVEPERTPVDPLMSTLKTGLFYSLDAIVALVGCRSGVLLLAHAKANLSFAIDVLKSGERPQHSGQNDSGQTVSAAVEMLTSCIATKNKQDQKKAGLKK